MQKKTCSYCKKEKKISEFYLLMCRGKLRRVSRCKKCSIENVKTYYKKHKKEISEKSRKKWPIKKLRAQPRKKELAREKKAQYVAYKGGKCQLCGYSKCISALEFHHKDPKEKEFNITVKQTTWEKAKKELDKCIMICVNCHRELHYKQSN